MDWTDGLDSVVEYIEKNLTNPIEYESLSRIACCSVSEFSRLFSFIAGMSVSDYIRRRRLSEAVIDIQNTGEKIIDIAVKYCYESGVAFTRAFKEMHGVTPLVARKSGLLLKTTGLLSFTKKPKTEVIRMAEIVKCYVQKLPHARFIGKKYGDDDRKYGGFGHIWDEWMEKGWFGVLSNLPQLENYEDAGSYVSYMCAKKDKPFEYYIGMLLPVNTPAPEGYTCFDAEGGDLGVCWVKGTEPEIYTIGDECEERLEKEGRSIKYPGGAWVSMERYVCPRNTEPDADGNVIVDICFFVESN